MKSRDERGYSTSVKGRDYVLHLSNGERTLCGRLAATVNCSDGEVSDDELCVVCRNARARSAAPVTTLEFEALQKVLFGTPWAGSPRGVGSRQRTQTLARLKRRGLIQNDQFSPYSLMLTDAGRVMLKKAGVL